MKKFLFTFCIIFLISITNSFAASGAADVYKVTMRTVEFCTGSTGVGVCTDAVVVGSGDKEIDIAAATAGAAAGSYGSAALLTLGVTYTHMRVTIDRAFGISSSFTTTGIGGDGKCTTNADLSGTSYPGGSLSGTEKYDRNPLEAANATQAEATLYLKNDQMEVCTNAACSSLSGAQTVTYGQGTGSSTYATQHADGSTSDDHVLIYTLGTAYTVTLIPPTIDISFGTSAAVKATEVSADSDLCYFDPLEPVVTITVN